MVRTYDSIDREAQAYSECHTRSAKRVLKALLANGGLPMSILNARSLIPRLLGIFIKLGQHMASLDVLPKEWTQTMAVLQDNCEPTPYEDIETLFLHDMGAPVAEIFDDFDKVPIGVASLAQVHVGHHKPSGRRVAVKVPVVCSFFLVSEIMG
jgi:aarF domain-containing kinase